MKRTARKKREEQKALQAEEEKKKKALAKKEGRKYEPTNLSLRDYIENYLKIITKDGQLINLHPNAAQDVLYKTFARLYNAEKPCKIIILKARQMGFSTMTAGIIASVVMTHYYTSALIMAHDPDSTNNIYNMYKRFYDNLPAPLKPMQKYSNARLLTFENPSASKEEKENAGLKSSIRVATAGQYGVGRSSTFQYMHLSEVAFWREQDGRTVQDQMTGLLQTLPQHGQSLLVIESTANGFNYFKKLWDDAVNGDSDFIPLFFPWYQMPEYRMEYNGERLTEEEEELKKQFELDNEQIMWRRYAIRTLCGGDINQFKQEYPATPEEAFIQTGNPFFDTMAVQKRLQSVRRADYVGEFTDLGHFYEAEKGKVEIWEMPKEGHTYVLSADTAGEGSDFFVAYVLDKDEGGHQIAKYRAQTDEPQFVKTIYWLATMYNYAMIAPETNFSTYCILKLQEMGYMNLYIRETADTYMPHIMKRFGFRTTSVTRPLVLDMLKEVVNYKADLIEDAGFFHEALSFVKADNGRPEAAAGSHDDCVMAMAIGLYVMPQASLHEIEEDILPNDYEQVRSFIEYGG